MCGRYRLKSVDEVTEWLGIPKPEGMLPRHNIAPTQRIFVLNGPRTLEPMQWGFVPVWASEKGRPLINAKAETVREKRSFKASIETRRCLVPADGFYEWSMEGKRPYLFTMHGDKPFALAGMWEPGREGNRCCFLTTTPNALLEPIHRRMPVILPEEEWEEWFSPHPLADESFVRMTAPYPAGKMEATEVSTLVNNARMDDPRVWESGAGPEPRKPVTRKVKADRDEQGMLPL
jgi:putative SOS response-associated peptidase YedK